MKLLIYQGEPKQISPCITCEYSKRGVGYGFLAKNGFATQVILEVYEVSNSRFSPKELLQR